MPYKAMEPVRDEDAPLVRHENGDGSALPMERRRSKWRLNRADLACLSIVGFVASFLLVWTPPMRPMDVTTPNSISMDASAAQQQQFQYMTYDDIDANKRANGYTVSYSKRGFVVDGRATLLLGGSIHYARSTPGMWEDLLRKAKNDGLNHIELYIFWNLHEPTRDVFHFQDRANLTHFYDLAAKVGLFLHVRFGPYACAEWNNGGLPWWLDTIPDMDVRSSATPWKQEMARFVNKMVDLSRPYMANVGGPIIMAQIENEYDEGDDAYVTWCGQLVTQLNTTIPWVMCNGKAANNTILTCNGDDCVDFADSQTMLRPTEPFMWTENEGWYQQWEHRPRGMAQVAEDYEDRDPEEMAYVIARWFAVGGAHHNYYMYHGGNNYGRTASAGVATKYADGVNLHSDGLSNEPKRSHLRKLHDVLITCNHVLLANDRQIHHAQTLTTPSQLAYIYGTTTGDQVVFLENDASSAVDVTFEKATYHLAPKSVLILKNGVVLFDTAAVRDSYPHKQKRVYNELVPSTDFQWQIWSERGDPRKAIVDTKPHEQLALTLDESDYMVYETTFSLDGGQEKSSSVTTLNFTACDANGFLVFIDGQFVEEVHLAYPSDDRKKQYGVKLPEWVGVGQRNKVHQLSIVSVGLGLFTLGRMHQKGITGDVTLNGKQSLIGDKTKWKMYPGLVGEHLKIYDPKWTASVPWVPQDKANSTKAPMSWYKTSFQLSRPRPPPPTTTAAAAAPVEETTSILLDAVGLTRGRIYLNGRDLGRLWLAKKADGDYVQRYYQIPADWLHSDPRTANELVIFDEMGGSINDVQVVLSSLLDDLVDPVGTHDGGGLAAPVNEDGGVVAAPERRAT